MVVLGFKCFCIFSIEKFKISKKVFSKGYFIIRLCMFMANFEVIGQKMTELWSFQVLSVFCIFCIEKIKISEKIFSKGYFRIRYSTFMTNFKVISKKLTELWLLSNLKLVKQHQQQQQQLQQAPRFITVKCYDLK